MIGCLEENAGGAVKEGIPISIERGELILDSGSGLASPFEEPMI